MKHIIKISLSFCLAALVSTNMVAQADFLDTTFHQTGKVMTRITPSYNGAFAITLQEDNKLVVAGWSYNGQNYDFALARYLNNGQLDESFSEDGKLTTDFGDTYNVALAVAVQKDGKIIAAGYSHNFETGYDFALVRYLPNGSIDERFGNKGIVVTNIGWCHDLIRAIAIQPDGKIVVAGYAQNMNNDDFALVRYLEDGTLDNHFGHKGKVATPIGAGFEQANALSIRPDGKIILAGYSQKDSSEQSYFTLAQYDSDGRLDANFGNKGIVQLLPQDKNGVARAMSLQKNGKIVVAGYAYTAHNEGFAIARFNENGSPDLNFGQKGTTTTFFGASATRAYAMDIQADDKIVLAGYLTHGADNDIALTRYHSDGNLDNNFGKNGILTSPINTRDDVANGMVIQKDGKIVIAGQANNGWNDNFVLVRYLPSILSNISQTALSNTPVVVYPNPVQQDATLEYNLDKEQEVSIQLFDVYGKQLATLLNQQTQSAGQYKHGFSLPNQLPKGVYFITLIANNERISVKITN